MLKIKLLQLIETQGKIKIVDDLAYAKLISSVDSGKFFQLILFISYLFINLMIIFILASQDAILFHLLPFLTGTPYLNIPEEQQVGKGWSKATSKGL